MKIFRDLAEIPEEYKGAVITLGNFDGLHIGHRAIIEQAKKVALEKKVPFALMTFEPHPREFFAKEKNKDGLRIYNLRSKLLAIKSLGVECVFLVRFNEQITNLTAGDFIKNIMVDKLQARHIITGENFCFGKNRQGDKDFLAQQAHEFGFSYTAYPHLLNSDNEVISSSNIRKLLKEGNIKKAGDLLGQPYHISGRVKYGEGRGKKLGFPTANVHLGKLSVPCYGVYAVRVRIDGKSEVYNAVANLGVKPTFGIHAPLLEVHVFGVQEDLYGKRLCVEFIDYIRPEQKFESLDALKMQIARDCETAKKILSLCE